MPTNIQGQPTRKPWFWDLRCWWASSGVCDTHGAFWTLQVKTIQGDLQELVFPWDSPEIPKLYVDCAQAPLGEPVTVICHMNRILKTPSPDPFMVILHPLCVPKVTALTQRTLALIAQRNKLLEGSSVKG